MMDMERVEMRTGDCRTNGKGRGVGAVDGGGKLEEGAENGWNDRGEASDFIQYDG